MEKIDVNDLKNRIQSLTVFRTLLSDEVIKSLCVFLDCVQSNINAAISAYCELVSEIYKTQSGSLAMHIKEICESCDNIYVKQTGAKKTPSDCIKSSVENELEILQSIADLTSQSLKALIEWKGFLPDFSYEKVDVAKSFWYRAENIEKFGFGQYAKHHVFYIDDSNKIVPINKPDSVTLDELVEYEAQKKIIIDNTKALLCGKAAQNILLTGDAGTGKSSTVKAVANSFYKEGLRIIEVRKDQLFAISKILDELSDNPLKFILFIDDLSFQKDDDNFNALKAVLEGSVSAKSNNVVIYVTSNRRHIIKEKFSDREGDDIHRNDTMQEFISLSERFGIHITFQKPNKETYLKIVRHIAKENNIEISDSDLELYAERFALERGLRSPRLAKQFVDGLLSR